MLFLNKAFLRNLRLKMRPASLLGRFYFVRSILFWLDFIFEKVSNRKSAVNDKLPSCFSDLSVKDTVKHLRQDGVAEGLLLPSAILQELLDFVAVNDCYAGSKCDLGFNISELSSLTKVYGDTFYTARYFNVSERCCAISKIVNDSKISSITKAYLGRRAQYAGCDLMWTFPVRKVSLDVDQMNNCSFHCDLWDYRTLKVFFYLSNVEMHGGQHVCVKKTHGFKKVHHVANLLTTKWSDQEIVNAYGHDRIKTMSGGVGYGFVEDVACYHKGTIPKTQPRLILILHFALNKYGRDIDYREPRKLKRARLLQHA